MPKIRKKVQPLQTTSFSKTRKGWRTGKKPGQVLILGLLFVTILLVAGIYQWVRRNPSSSAQTPPVVVKSGTVEVMAPPAPKWSDRVLTPGWTDFDSDGKILVKLSKGNPPVEFDPDDKKDLGQTEWLEFQSQTTVAVKVTVTKK